MSEVYVNSWGRSNKLSNEYRNGCHNRAPFIETYWVPDGWEMVGEGVRMSKVVEVPFTMKKECSYQSTELGRNDKGCTNCKWRER